MDNNIIWRKIAAWVVLFFLVWLFGSTFLTAISTGNKASRDIKDLEEKQTESSSQVKISDGSKVITAKEIGKIEVTQNGLNLRSEPKKRNNVIKSLNKGTVLPVTKKVDNWYEVLINGKKGYVSSSPSYIKVLQMK